MKTRIFGFLLFVFSIFLPGNAGASDLGIKSGDWIENELSFGVGRVKRSLPLATGRWLVVWAVEAEAQMIPPSEQQRAMKLLNILLVQLDGRRVAMAMHLFGSKETSTYIPYRHEDPCKRAKEPLHRNAYNSNVSDIRCLLISSIHLAGMNSGVYAELHKWIVRAKLEIPENVLVAEFSDLHEYDFFRLTFVSNPAFRTFALGPRSGVANPFQPELMVSDSERREYVKDFAAWAEAYVQRISSQRVTGADPGGIGSPIVRPFR